MENENLKADLSWRPRLSHLRPLTGPTPESEGRRATTPAERLKDRTGYDAAFLGDFHVPWPGLTGIAAQDIQAVTQGPGIGKTRLDYMHFSVSMSTSRRMARFVGVNIHGKLSEQLPREADSWHYDGRIPIEAQIGHELYASTWLDRGHLVRREDPNWGEDAPIANEDTFHFTNCAPQMRGFNQKTWLGLERYVLNNARLWKERVSVFSGPVFKDDDGVLRGVWIPEAFWKVLAFLSDDGKPSATAYIISQAADLKKWRDTQTTPEAAYAAFKTYQCSVRTIEELTDINFGALRDFDGFSNEESDTGIKQRQLIDKVNDIRV